MAKTVAIANTDMFTEIEDAKALISARGVWMQTGVYHRDNMLFVAYGKGFVRLLSRSMTTVPHVKWEAIEGVNYREEYNGPRLGLAVAGGNIKKAA